MTSIQLPPLQFEDGGFRVSIITGGSSADATTSNSDGVNPPAASDPEPTATTASEIKAQELELNAESELDLKTPTQANPEPARTPSPRIGRKPVPKPVQQTPPKREPETESEPETKSPESVSRINSQYQLAPVSYQRPDQINIQLDAYSESGSEPAQELEAVPFKIDPEVNIPGRDLTEPAGELEAVPFKIGPVVKKHSRHISDATDDSYVNDMPGRRAPSPPAAIVPSHPIESLQQAFAESLEEVTRGGAEKPKLREVDAKTRRERLLDQGKEDEPHDARWRYRPGQKQHEVLKLISQISFGVYLLLNGMANDNTQVVSILQGHIDEVDEYLEVTLEDIGQASADLNERTDYLKLPMSNMKVFEGLLEDRNYRAEILEGNEKIEQVLARQNVVMKQWDDDVDAGLHGATAFNDWLNTLKNGEWRNERPDLEEIFDAMKGNADGWLNAFDEMNSQTQDMNSVIIKLMTLVAEMEKKAGEISRKTWSTIPPFTSPKSGSLNSRTSVSTPRSVQSNARSNTRVSVKSGSTSIAQQSLAEGDDEDGLDDFPLPGAAPLLLPSRSSQRLSKKASIVSMDTPKLRVDTAQKPSPVRETHEEEKEDGPLYILQPRTYTPQPPEPLPSPRVRESPKSPPSARREPQRESDHTNTRSSIRHRVSLKKSIPESLRISSNHSLGRPDSRPSPVFTSPRQSNNTSFLRDSSSSHLQVRDSSSSSIPVRDSNGSDIEAFRQHNLPRVASHAELGPVRPSLMKSPNSDYQHYHPVRASPHSPLQQRPHTAAGPQPRQSTGYFPQHLRGQPSRLGSMATLDQMVENPDNRTLRQGAPSVGGARSVGGKTLKKKKSAFGWFKKAFTMDEEERAAFEARKNHHQPDNYYKDKSPKFLDGKRMR